MFLIIDKPKGITSHDVVYRIRKITGVKRVGHGGTLDPNATGLLIIGVGREYTKQLGVVLKGLDKTYEAEIALGEDRDSYDAEGAVTKKYEVKKTPSEKQIETVLKEFLGKQSQTPPAYSAVKINGMPAYKIARKGKLPKTQPKEVEVKKLNLINYNFPILLVEAKVSSGTYIRTLSYDIGQKLQTGGYLRNLRRIAVGSLNVKNAASLDEIKNDNWQSYGFKKLEAQK